MLPFEAFPHCHDNSNLVSFAPLLDYLMSFRVGKATLCPKSEQVFIFIFIM